MAKLENEVKILDVDKDEVLERLKMIAVDKGEKNQRLYTYDLPTLKFRFSEAKQLMHSDNKLLVDTSVKKLKQVILEYMDLEDERVLGKIYDLLGVKDFDELFAKSDEEFIKLIDGCPLLEERISDYRINPNKWIRLRQSNDKVELTVKNIYNKSDTSFQKVKEYEVSTSSFEETNLLLESIGLVRRNYQEKRRHSFEYKSASLELDEWPMLEPYLEIECDDLNVISELVKLLGLEDNEMVSLNTEVLYKRKGIDILSLPELKFDSGEEVLTHQ